MEQTLLATPAPPVHKNINLESLTLQVAVQVPTCQGYSLASVSTPPTILVTLLAWPQLHVAVVVVAVVVVMVTAVLVVVIGDGVDVDGVVVTGAEQFGHYKRYNKIPTITH